MYILLEYVTCVALAAGAVAALLVLGWTCVALVQILHRAAGRLLLPSSLAALSLGRLLFIEGDNRVAVKVSTAEARTGRAPLERSGTGMPRDPW